MNNTVDEFVKQVTETPREHRAKKQKIKRSTTKQLRKESKQIAKDYK